jgi:hypothetical protein
MLWGSKGITGGTRDIKNEESKLDIDNFNRFEVGFNAGGGIYIPINGKNKIEIEFKYERSFRNQKSMYPTGTTTFSLSAGYAIKLIK